MSLVEEELSSAQKLLALAGDVLALIDAITKKASEKIRLFGQTLENILYSCSLNSTAKEVYLGQISNLLDTPMEIFNRIQNVINNLDPEIRNNHLEIINLKNRLRDWLPMGFCTIDKDGKIFFS